MRDRAYRAADTLADLRDVVAVTPVSGDKSRTGRWCVHVLIRDDCNGVPPAVGNLLAGYDLRLRDVHHGVEFWHATATA